MNTNGKTSVKATPSEKKKGGASPRRGVSDIDRLIGTRIRAFRLEQKKSQEELGGALNLTFQQIQKYEKGTNRVSAGRLVEICKALGYGIEDFYEGVIDRRSAAPTTREKFMASREGNQIIEAMIKIKRPAERQKVIDIAVTLGR